jgi:adenine phosphoribosyltransferase
LLLPFAVRRLFKQFTGNIWVLTDPSGVIMSNASANTPFDPADYINSQIRTVPDWPAAGVQFRDITPLLQKPKTLRVLIDLFVQRYIDQKLDYVAGLDARGFIIGPILAYELNLGFIPIRKIGKLPYKTVSESYKLEYGEATVEIHEDACKPGDRVVIVDDLIATGGTMMAGKKLLERLGATVIEGAAIVDLPDLGGSTLLREGGLPLFTVTSFGGH